MPKNAVIDASVLVSAFLFPESLPAQVLILGDRGLCKLHVSEILLEEVRRALQKPRLIRSYAYDENSAAAWVHALRDRLFVIQRPLPDIQSECRDPDDDHVLAAALVSGANVIITGDVDLLSLKSFQDIDIINPRDYLARLKAV
jgi:putative PIN family toxin of toxin-antitoxin system